MKPSELPKNTFIEFDGVDGGLYRKHEDNMWMQVDAHCVECVIFVADDLSKLPNSWEAARFPSDEFFKEFKIVSLPPVETIRGAIWWMQMNTIAGEAYDGISILDDYLYALEEKGEQPTLKIKKED